MRKLGSGEKIVLHDRRPHNSYGVGSYEQLGYARSSDSGVL